MLFNNKYCFLHYPKTAGKSLTRYFVQAWENPIEGFISPGQVDELKDCGLENTNIKVGRGHENLSEAKSLIDLHGNKFENIEAIFVCIRNPYDLMVSNYHFMRKTYKNNKTKENFKIANDNDFTSYCEKVGMSSPAGWMELDGAQPKNLFIIRFERLDSDLKAGAEKYGFNHQELAKLNSSKHEHYSSYMSQSSEEAIYLKFKYIFDKEYYEREEFSKVPKISLQKCA